MLVKRACGDDQTLLAKLRTLRRKMLSNKAGRKAPEQSVLPSGTTEQPAAENNHYDEPQPQCAAAEE